MNRSDRDRAFEDWKLRADQSDLLATAIMYGAVLKRAGREHVGPCPGCGGTDRFSINPSRNLWHCRGHQGGGHGAIGMVQHIAALSFLQACEALTGEPNPTSRGPAKPLSDAELAERNRRRLETEARQASLKAQEMAHENNTRDAAAKIWLASTAVRGTIAERYLQSRGLIAPDGNAWLRFNPSLNYPGKGPMPALVCRVDDLTGDLCAVWRIFLKQDGSGKADVENPKLGLGPAGGGAVRIGGVGKTVAIAEGVESAIGFWLLTNRRHPTWASLSTAGMIGIEIPLGVERVIVVPDGDRPIAKRDGQYVPAIPAGRMAAQALRARLMIEGVACVIAAEPKAGKDYADLWSEHQREDA